MPTAINSPLTHSSTKVRIAGLFLLLSVLSPAWWHADERTTIGHQKAWIGPILVLGYSSWGGGWETGLLPRQELASPLGDAASVLSSAWGEMGTVVTAMAIAVAFLFLLPGGLVARGARGLLILAGSTLVFGTAFFLLGWMLDYGTYYSLNDRLRPSFGYPVFLLALSAGTLAWLRQLRESA